MADPLHEITIGSLLNALTEHGEGVCINRYHDEEGKPVSCILSKGVVAVVLDDVVRRFLDPVAEARVE